MSELFKLSLCEVRDLLRTGEVSAEAVTQCTHAHKLGCAARNMKCCKGLR